MNQTRPQIGRIIPNSQHQKASSHFLDQQQLQSFTSNHRPRELWEIPSQRLNCIEVFTRHVQIDTCRCGGVKTSTWALPAPQQSQDSLLTHPHCPAAYPNIWCPGNVQQWAKWSVELHPRFERQHKFVIVAPTSKIIQSMSLIPTLHRIHHSLMQSQTMKEGSQMSANVIILFINLPSIHPEPKILF